MFMCIKQMLLVSVSVDYYGKHHQQNSEVAKAVGSGCGCGNRVNRLLAVGGVRTSHGAAKREPGPIVELGAWDFAFFGPGVESRLYYEGAANRRWDQQIQKSEHTLL
jgi:hypothetical protein